MAWAKRYNQDSILFKPFDSLNAMVVGTNPEPDPNGRRIPYGQMIDIGRWHANLANPFITSFRKTGGDRSFAFKREHTGRAEAVYISPISFFSRDRLLFHL